MSESKDSEKRRSVVQSLPSDYRDVQPKNYDPDFISDISNKMQIPDTLPAVHDDEEDRHARHSRFSGGWDEGVGGHHMNVPERILLGGGGVHIGTKPELRTLDFGTVPHTGYSEPVALLTPPRTLTVEEQFPVVEEDEVEIHKTPRRIPNGTVAVPEPYTPGMSTSDSLLLNDEDETTQLKTQVSKLMRRVAVLERDQSTQSKREMMLYTTAVGYFMLKFLFWFFRNK